MNPFTGDLMIDMEIVRMTCERGHALRKKAGIPVRQALSSVSIKWTEKDLLEAIDRAYNPKRGGIDGLFWKVYNDIQETAKKLAC